MTCHGAFHLYNFSSSQPLTLLFISLCSPRLHPFKAFPSLGDSFLSSLTRHSHSLCHVLGFIESIGLNTVSLLLVYYLPGGRPTERPQISSLFPSFLPISLPCFLFSFLLPFPSSFFLPSLPPSPPLLLPLRHLHHRFLLCFVLSSVSFLEIQPSHPQHPPCGPACPHLQAGTRLHRLSSSSPGLP